MAVLRCKMCGGKLNVEPDMSIVECDYCGTVQTIPNVDNEKKVTLFERANRLRSQCEFNKAYGVYEAIVAEFPEEAEAYWGLVLCKYGIEYVDDALTGKKIPTCHCSSFEAVMEDSNYEMAMEYADPAARRVYRTEAKAIENLREAIIEISGKEEPYDIFICYKETDDESGERTLDSVLAQDVYDALTEKGYRVFFSRISLEDKLGQEYEPYIFAALNSAKVMLVFGTDYEYFDAVWVKNEWYRYLLLMKRDRNKHLIPCYKNIDVRHDLPKEFAKLQAQDLGKVGATQDLLRGIEKLLPKEETQANQPMVQSVIQPTIIQNTNADNIVALGFMDLKVGKKESAENSFREALKQDSGNVGAYFGLCLLTSGDEQEMYFEHLTEKSPEVCVWEQQNIDKNNYIDYLTLCLNHLDEKRVSFLFKQFYKLEEKNVQIMKLLSDAVCDGDVAKVKLLLKNGADPNSYRDYEDQYGESRYCVLSDAIWNAENVEIVRLLLEHGADIHYFEKTFCDDGSIEICSPLIYAVCDAKNLEITQLLLENGADANCYAYYEQEYKQMIPALITAIWECDNVEIVRLLLRYGADPNSQRIEKHFSKEYKIYALSEAISENNIEIVKLLLDYEANIWYSEEVDSARTNGIGIRTPLSYAITDACSVEMVELLLEHGVGVNDQITWNVIDSSYEEEGTPLFYAMISSGENEDIVNMLLKHGADWNAKVVMDGSTYILNRIPLHRYPAIASPQWLKKLQSLGWKKPGLFG